MTLQRVSNLAELKAVNDFKEKIIAYPTESVFGLGCRVDKLEIIEEILNLKDRNIEKGFVVLASSLEQLKGIVDFSLLTSELKELLEIVNYPRGNSPYSPFDDLPGVSREFKNKFLLAYQRALERLMPIYKKGYLIESVEHQEHGEIIGVLLELMLQVQQGIFSIPDDKRKLEALYLACALHNSGQGITFLLPAAKSCPQILHGKFATVAVRFTQEPFLVKLIKILGGALVSTSANYSGQDSIRTADQVAQMLDTDFRSYLADQVILIDKPVIYDPKLGVKESILVNPLSTQTIKKLEKKNIGIIPPQGINRNKQDILYPNMDIPSANLAESVLYTLMRFCIDRTFTVYCYNVLSNYYEDPDVEHNEAQLNALMQEVTARYQQR
ncbi:Sua5/YciO/YrdC/YwlC family protein [Psittacicella gerlachiana]|uniref:L-threonylcarbamoyladenylate synthase n=1 Tax=Psittacicella gerlachiana TaxID=2028574 RepID=A0A3A1YC66_9GAMM|nr:Sua5/YciO/YrdC/YwlC family protein [Psittacicella gerlachiana]RIY35141.1 hypothetical protein CKF59_04140 [Psittacicella gerlachiana]